MNLRDMIGSLLEEKKNLDAAIARIEEIQKAEETGQSRRRRGRKFMSPEERQLVSERMRKYWKNRRSSAGAPFLRGGGNSSPSGG